MDVIANHSQHQIKNGLSFSLSLGCSAWADPCFGTVHEMDEDKAFYQATLGITRSISFEKTLRKRMDDIGDCLCKTILNENVNVLLYNKM